MAKLLIEESVLQSVVDYLTTKPFNEVNNLIVKIQQNSKMYEEPPTEPPEPADEPPSTTGKGVK